MFRAKLIAGRKNLVREFQILMSSLLSVLTVLSVQPIAAQLTRARKDSSRSTPISDSTNWRVGSELDKFSRSGLSASFSNAMLGERLRGFAVAQRAAVFIDRRVDPTQAINLSMHGTLETFYWQIAKKLQLGVCRIESLYYFGPSRVAADLPIALQDLSKQRIGETADRLWRKKSTMSTAEVVQPRELLEQLATKHGFKIESLETLPHDVWSKVELPPTSLETQVALILVGFGKWFERKGDGLTIEIVDFPSIENGQRRFGNISDAREQIKSLQQKFPDLKLTSTARSITASGRPTQIAELRRALVEQSVANSQPGETKVYSLNTKASRGTILATMAARTKRKFEFTPDSRKSLQEQIKISVKDVTFEDLVEEVRAQTNLKIKIETDKLSVSLDD